MRSKLMGVLLGCGLLAATVVPALACNYTNASTETQAPQQTAQAQPAQSDTQE
ncbi:MAG: hypothetical protein ACLQE9_18275 [Roseiarcus sp.]